MQAICAAEETFVAMQGQETHRPTDHEKLSWIAAALLRPRGRASGPRGDGDSPQRAQRRRGDLQRECACEVRPTTATASTMT